jgi:hypothetical protein
VIGYLVQRGRLVAAHGGEYVPRQRAKEYYIGAE